MTVFILCGLWHGASWNFLFFGLYQAIFLVVERLVRIKRIPLFQTLFGNVYLVFVVMTTMVFFRTDNLNHAVNFFQTMFGFGHAVPGEYQVAAYLNPEFCFVIVAAVLGSMPFIPWLNRLTKRPGFEPIRQIVTTVFLSGVFIWAVMKLAAGTHNPFIYFRF